MAGAKHGMCKLALNVFCDLGGGNLTVIYHIICEYEYIKFRVQRFPILLITNSWNFTLIYNANNTSEMLHLEHGFVWW
jgi:hypothetical protein